MRPLRWVGGAVLFFSGLLWAADQIPPPPKPPAPFQSAAPVLKAPVPPPVVPVRFGIDVLESNHFALLQGKQVGLITNQSAVDSRGRRTADVLADAQNVRLVALFSPEHGLRGYAANGQSVGDTIDPVTHLPVYSLYGTTRQPTPEMLNAVDVLVFDMQDVGVRFYTFLTTMGMAMEEAARRHIEFIVLDRPDPLGGQIIEGETLTPRYRDFTAYFDVPVRHGFTAGEMARWYNATARLHLNLKVVPMAGWKRSDLWDQTGHPFIDPSPAIQSPTEALLYAGIGMFEATNVSVGRGTSAPFEQFGAPWIDGNELARRLNEIALPGLTLSPVEFTPVEDLYQGQRCSGVRISVTDPEAARPVDLFVEAACVLRAMDPKDFQLRWEEIGRVTGSGDFQRMYQAGRPASAILKVFHRSAEQFKQTRRPYLLY